MDHLEDALRDQLRAAAAELTPAQTTLHHPGEDWTWEQRPPRRRRALAVAASVAATAGLTAAVVGWGGLADRLLPAPPVTPARVEQTAADLRAIETALPSVLALQAPVEQRCLAEHGYEVYLGPGPRRPSPLPGSALSGSRSTTEAQTQGYGMDAYRQQVERRAAYGPERQASYDWVDDPPDPDWDGDRLRAAYDTLHDRVTRRPDCRQEAVDQVWGEDADAGTALLHAMSGSRLFDATAAGIVRADGPEGDGSPGEQAWRRCMLDDPVVTGLVGADGGPGPLGGSIDDALRRAVGVTGSETVEPRTPAQLAQARRVERAVAVRDATCSAEPVVAAGTADKERFQTEWVLRHRPQRADDLHEWRAALERTLARHRR